MVRAIRDAADPDRGGGRRCGQALAPRRGGGARWLTRSASARSAPPARRRASGWSAATPGPRSATRRRARRWSRWPRASGRLVVTIGAVVAALIALSIVVGYVAGVEVDGEKPRLARSLAPALIMGIMAWGMWRARYWAVLGFQLLLVFLIFSAVFGLARAGRERRPSSPPPSACSPSPAPSSTSWSRRWRGSRCRPAPEISADEPAPALRSTASRRSRPTCSAALRMIPEIAENTRAMKATLHRPALRARSPRRCARSPTDDQDACRTIDAPTWRRSRRRCRSLVEVQRHLAQLPETMARLDDGIERRQPRLMERILTALDGTATAASRRLHEARSSR